MSRYCRTLEKIWKLNSKVIFGCLQILISRIILFLVCIHSCCDKHMHKEGFNPEYKSVVHKYSRLSNLFLFNLVGTRFLFLCLIMLILLLWSRILLAEAELAARALEAAGARDENLTRSLLEARTLLDEANKTLWSRWGGISFTSYCEKSYVNRIYE